MLWAEMGCMAADLSRPLQASAGRSEPGLHPRSLPSSLPAGSQLQKGRVVSGWVREQRGHRDEYRVSCLCVHCVSLLLPKGGSPSPVTTLQGLGHGSRSTWRGDGAIPGHPPPPIPPVGTEQAKRPFVKGHTRKFCHFLLLSWRESCRPAICLGLRG